MTSEDMIRLIADATIQHHIRAMRRGENETCACGQVIPEKEHPDRSRLWEEHWAQVSLDTVRPALVAEIFREVAQLAKSYPDDDRAVIAEMGFMASLDQLALEKYGVNTGGES